MSQLEKLKMMWASVLAGMSVHREIAIRTFITNTHTHTAILDE